MMYHENYTSDRIRNDIAFIYMSKATEKILENPYVGLIALPTPEDAKIDLSGKISTISGFGRVSDSGERPKILQYAKLPVESNEECKEFFGTLIKNSHLCVDTKGGSSSCNGEKIFIKELFEFAFEISNLASRIFPKFFIQLKNFSNSPPGDSGGPLIAEISPNRTVIIGVVSFGSGEGCERGNPAVFERVTSHLDWIEKHKNSAENYGKFPKIFFLIWILILLAKAFE